MFRIPRRISNGLSSILVILGWATSTASLALYAMFQGYLLPIAGGGTVTSFDIGPIPIPILIFYLGNLGVCILAAIVIADTAKSVLLFFPSYVGAWIITYSVLILPDVLGCCGGVLELSAVSFTLTAFFPYLFITELAGTFLGIAISGIIQ